MSNRRCSFWCLYVVTYHSLQWLFEERNSVNVTDDNSLA